MKYSKIVRIVNEAEKAAALANEARGNLVGALARARIAATISERASERATRAATAYSPDSINEGVAAASLAALDASRRARVAAAALRRLGAR